MLYRFFTLFFVVLALTSCAKVGRPSGGDKDTTAPISISAKPDFNSLNFKSKKIKIYFDEYIKFKDLNKQLVISPPLKYTPEITPLGTASKYISIAFKDTLKENTTYSLNFGNAIQDNSEGNLLKQFKYIFSTGNYIDSLSVSGRVKNAFNSDEVKNISILLYALDSLSSDSIIYKQKPNYIANTLDSIHFSVTNIKKGSYLLIALNDVSGDMLFTPKEDMIGFLNKPIKIPTDSIFELRIAKEEVPFSVKKVSEISENHILIPYEGELAPTIKKLYDKNNVAIAYHYYKDMATDSLHLWHQKSQTDTLYIAVTHKDSTNIHPIRLRSKEKDSLQVSKNISQLLHLRDSLYITTNIPLSKIDAKYINLFDKDSVSTPFTIKMAASKMKFLIDFNRKEKEKYTLDILPTAITDFYGQQNDSIQYSFSTKSPEDYGEIILDIEAKVDAPIIVELLNPAEKVVAKEYCKSSKTIRFSALLPKEYKLRFTIDKNHDKKWTTGSFLKRIQPEKVIYFDKKIELRANWSISEKITIK